MSTTPEKISKDSTIPAVKLDGMHDQATAEIQDGQERWVARAREGDSEAFTMLCRTHYLLVYRVAYRVCGCREDAQDVAQETFVKAASAIRYFRGEARFTTWIYRIAMRTSIDLLRQKRHRWDVSHRLALDQQMAEQAHVSPTDRTVALLGRLPAKQRAALILTVCEGMSHAEAAKVLGCVEATVSWRVHRAKRTLRRWLTM